MGTHWHYPNFAPPAESPWGFLTLERQKLRTSQFLYTGLGLTQVHAGCDIVNLPLPSTGQPPTAQFDLQTNGLALTTTNKSKGQNLNYWMFGDSGVSNAFNPNHSYPARGTYLLSLRVSAANGLMDLATKWLSVSSGGTPPTAPKAPVPSNKATAVLLPPTLRWAAAAGATSYDVFFGKPSSPHLAANVKGTSYSPGALTTATVYYWRIEAKNSAGSTSSPTWWFRTSVNPGAPTTPSPHSNATGVSRTPTLEWIAGAGATSYDVYFGAITPPPFRRNTTVTSFTPTGLTAKNKYYWRVVAKSGTGIKTSPTWSFTTR
jgi:hypothetical protein